MSYRFKIATLGAAIVSLAVSASAQQRDVVWDSVKLEDLNLQSAAGHQTARERIDAAAQRACTVGNERNLRERADIDRCRAEVRASGDRRVADIQARQRYAEQQRLAAERAALAREAAANRPVATRRATATRYRSCTWPKRYAYKKRVCVWRYRR